MGIIEGEISYPGKTSGKKRIGLGCRSNIEQRLVYTDLNAVVFMGHVKYWMKVMALKKEGMPEKRDDIDENLTS